MWFPAKPYYFPSSCYNCFLCQFTYFGGPLTCALYFCVGNMERFPRVFLLLFSLASILFSTRYLPLSLPAVSHTCSSAQEQEYRHGFVMRAASISFWMNDTQASSQQLHLTDPATVFQDEVLTVRLVREDSSTNIALRSLSQQLGSSNLLQKVQTTAMTKQTNCSSSAGCQSTNIQGTVRVSQSSISQGKKFN